MTRLRQILARHRGPEDPEPNGNGGPEPAPSPVRQPKQGGFADLIRENITIVVVVVVLAVIVGVVVGIVVTQGDDAEDAAESIAGGVATYDANCNGQIVARIGVVLDPSGATDNVDIVFANDDAGYRQPTGTGDGAFNGTAATASATLGQFGVAGAAATGTETIGFIRSVDNLTETVYNADFNNNNRIDAGEVVALITRFSATAPTFDTEMAEVGTGATNTRIATNGPNILAADPDVAITGVQVGSQILVNRASGCWGVRI